MKIYTKVPSTQPYDFSEGSAVAIGKFDGIHRGHRRILDRVRGAAPLRSVAFTFSNNPLSLLRPKLCPPPLTSPKQRLELLAAEGLDACVMVEFDEAVAAISAERFIEDVLVGALNARLVVLGADFRFGFGGFGDAELLKRIGELHGFSVEVVTWVTEWGHQHVSSSLIREAVLHGDIEAAVRMLGRLPVVRGEVLQSDSQGSEYGSSTLTLGGHIEGLVPADGVYAGWVEAGRERYAATILVGVDITFGAERESRVKAVLPDFAGNLDGLRIEISFSERLPGVPLPLPNGRHMIGLVQ